MPAEELAEVWMPGKPDSRIETAGAVLPTHWSNRWTGWLRRRSIVLIAVATTSGAAADGPLTGEWRVTELTGSITTTNGGPAPPDGLCTEQGSNTVQAVLDDESTFVKVLEPFGEIKIPKEILWDYAESPPPGYPLLEKLDPTHQFLFSFAFDNGYHSNSVLEATHALASNFPEDPEVRKLVAKILFGRLPDVLPGDQGAYYVGTVGWDKKEAAGTAVGVTLLTQQGFGSGISRFLVLGNFEGPRRLVGEWVFEESAEAFGCTQVSVGRGGWTAVAPD